MQDRIVAICSTEPTYPVEPPFHPDQLFPEYPFGRHAISRERNPVYTAVRESLALLGLDIKNFGSRAWNPLASVVEPGMTVVIKPNFVLSRHKHGKELFSIITHPSVLRSIADYCWIALKGSGRIIIADAPQYDCNFNELVKALSLDALCGFYASTGATTVEYRDLRSYWSRARHFPSMLEPLDGDPEGSVRIDLKEKSAFQSKCLEERLYGAVYHRRETIQSHSNGRHQYEIAGTILHADAVISCPKLKVHKKVGVTLNAKGLVGTATNKNYLVHYTLGTPRTGGDQFPEHFLAPHETMLINIERWMYDHLLAPQRRSLEYLHRSIYWLHNHTLRRFGFKVAEWKRNMDAGNWYGNDSAWRMTVDLVRALRFADRRGHLRPTPQRRFFSVIDGIIGGDNNGPLTPDPVRSGVLVAGTDLLATDLAATALMGFDPMRLRLYKALLNDPSFGFEFASLEDISVTSNVSAWNTTVQDLAQSYLTYRPHPGWVGQIEWDRTLHNTSVTEQQDTAHATAAISR